MTANDNPLCNGSKRYFKKPVTIYDLSSLWMYLKWKIEDGSIVTEDVRSYVNNNQEFQPFLNARGQTLQIGKRKEQRHKIGGNQSESLLLKRKRLSWTGDSHTKFLGGVEFSGTSGKFGLKFIVYLFLLLLPAIRVTLAVFLRRSSSKSKTPA